MFGNPVKAEEEEEPDMRGTNLVKSAFSAVVVVAALWMSLSTRKGQRQEYIIYWLSFTSHHPTNTPLACI